MLRKAYYNFWALDEFETNQRLRWFCYVILFSMSAMFGQWSGRGIAFLNSRVSNGISCWPYYKDCSLLHELSVPPDGNSYNILFIVMSFLIASCGFSLLKKRYVTFHLIASCLFVIEFFFLFIWSTDYIANFNYYHIVLLFFLLFSAPRIQFLRVAFVFLYFLAGQVKFDAGWVLGSYFTTLVNGMAFVPDSLAPMMCFLVVSLEVIGTWFLLSNRLALRFSALTLFTLFHLYSILYVGFRYPLFVVPPLFVLFATKEKFYFPASKMIKCRLGIGAFVIGLTIHLLGDLIAGDEKITLEGYSYGLYMFDANHQCRSQVAIFKRDGNIDHITEELRTSMERCDPYRRWEKIKRVCQRDSQVNRIAWVFDHSINGRPFYRIIDVPNACQLSYQAFRHNNWILTPEEGAKIVGYPVKNVTNLSVNFYVESSSFSTESNTPDESPENYTESKNNIER